MADFAILAPVPQEHLISGQAIAADIGFVAFGSRKFELFRDIDLRRDGDPVPVLIYPSYEDDLSKVTSLISWRGWYIGSEETHNGRHSLGMKHRPQRPASMRLTTSDTGRSSGMCVNSRRWRPATVSRSRDCRRSREAGARTLLRAGQNSLQYPHFSGSQSSCQLAR